MTAAAAGSAFIAVDWGTSNRRMHLVAAEGRLLRSVCDELGALTVPPDGYPRAVADIRAEFGSVPLLAAGMVGSNRGWCEVPYVGLPADLDVLAAGAAQLGGDVTIVPGVCRRDPARPDVMRGEEVQVLGAIAGDMAPADAMLCQPGTHNKWIVAERGRIVDFTTAMTGELFALLRANGILRGMLDGPVTDGPAFRDGLARGSGCRDLAAALFEVRAGILVGVRAADEAAAFASGVLIGADVGSRADLAGRDVYLLSSGMVANLYVVALEHAGAHALLIDSDVAFAFGAAAMLERLQ